MMAVGSKDLTAEQLRGFDEERLAEDLRKAKEELFNLRFQYATRQLTNTARIREVRRDIARVLTLQHDAALVGGGE